MMKRLRQRKLCCQITAFAVMLQLLFVQAMAASPSLHKQCHDHADDPGHQCAVTLVLSGGYDKVVPDIEPVNVATEPPSTDLSAPETVLTVPGHLIGGVMANSPPRAP